MDTKLRKSKAVRKVGIDLLVIIVAAISGILIIINEFSYQGLSIGYTTSSFLLELIAIIILSLLAARLFRYVKTPHNKRSFWDGSLLLNYFHIWRTGFIASLQNGRLTFGLILMFMLTATAGICFWEAITYYGQEWLVLYLLLFVLFLVPYILSKLSRFISIINGSKEIAKGNIQNSIQYTGNDSLSELAGYINNMKTGYQSALEHQMKSERLKTELITNVSHDLKTPLTSIINYVDLLKKKIILRRQL